VGKEKDRINLAHITYTNHFTKTKQGQWDDLEDFLSQEARRLLAEQQSASGAGGGRRSRYEEQKSAYDDRGSSTGPGTSTNNSGSGSGATPARALLSEVSVQFLPQVRKMWMRCFVCKKTTN
jgi:hypothetical protein